MIFNFLKKKSESDLLLTPTAPSTTELNDLLQVRKLVSKLPNDKLQLLCDETLSVLVKLPCVKKVSVLITAYDGDVQYLASEKFSLDTCESLSFMGEILNKIDHVIHLNVDQDDHSLLKSVMREHKVDESASFYPMMNHEAKRIGLIMVSWEESLVSKREQEFIENVSKIIEAKIIECALWQLIHDFSFIEEKKRNKELKRAKDEAEAASRMKSEFLANMSHEIRTPMNVVLGMAEILKSSELTKEQQADVETMYSSGQTLLNIINDILEFSKLEAGRIRVEDQLFDMQLAVEDVVKMLASQCQNSEVDLVLRYVPGTPRYVYGDMFRLKQILINIINNAIKFTEKGNVTCTVDYKLDAEKPHFLFSIRDTGRGIPDSEDINSIFESFNQADNSLTREYQGTGLGLAISKSLTELMGGSIGAKNHEEGGALFYFDLPLEVEEGMEPEMIFPDDMRQLKMLVVEKNKSQRDVLVELVSSYDMRCDACDSAQMAFKLLQEAYQNEEPYHIVLIDIRLEEVFGSLLFTAIEDYPEIAKIVFLMLVPLRRRNKFVQVLGTSFERYILKPVAETQFLETVVNAWQSRSEIKPMQDITITSEQQSVINDEVNYDNVKVLVVDDSEENRRLANRYLEQIGTQNTLAESAFEALDYMKNTDFDIVFMDIQMPKMNGYEAIEKMRQLPQGKEIPIVAFTALALHEDREKCLASGANDYLSKPVKMSHFQEVLKKWVVS